MISHPVENSPDDSRPRIRHARVGARRSWNVGGDRVELERDRQGWTARVLRRGWAGTPLAVDGHFADEAEAVAWCEDMADVLLRDLEDEAE